MDLFITKIAIYLPNRKIDFSNSVCVAASAKQAHRIASTVFAEDDYVQILETSPVPFDLIKTVYESKIRR